MLFAQPEVNSSYGAISCKPRLLLSSSRHKPRPQQPPHWTRNSSTWLQTRHACCSFFRRTYLTAVLSGLIRLLSLSR
eukprot:9514236-Prorocentrum_lima.AAC.1